jgi:hypothetical protein
MRLYEINNKQYVSLTDAYKELGINPGYLLKIKIRMTGIGTHIIDNYIPEEHIGKSGRYGFKVIDEEGLTILAKEASSSVRNKDRINLFIENPDFIFQRKIETPDIESPTTEHISTIVDVEPPTTIEKYETLNNIASDGVKIMVEMFDGVNKVRYHDDESGMRWTLGMDLYKTMKLEEKTFNTILTRIKKRYPEYTHVFDAKKLTSATKVNTSKIDELFPELKKRGNKNLIYLNKYGVALFFQEINISRIKDPKAQELCYKFKDWMAHLVGDVLTGDVEVFTKEEIKKIRATPIKKTMRTIVEQFTLATCMVSVGGLPEKECIETALTNIEKTIPHLTGIDTWKTTLQNHYMNIMNQLPESSSVITTQNNEIEKIVNDINRRVKNIENATVGIDSVRFVLDNHGENGKNLLSEKILDEAASYEANKN